MLFDTHAHLNDSAFDADRDKLLESLPEHNVTRLMIPAWSLESSRTASDLAQKYDYVYAAVGAHPDHADEVCDDMLDALRDLCRATPKIKAIGEIGLDYHYEDVPRDIQQKAFRMQMALAQELDMPVIVHERDAHEDGMRIVSEFPKVTGVFHCYSGSLEMARWLVERGWSIGFTGVLTFKNARKALDVAANIPLDRIVLETDCPYMAPTPFRGSRCDPTMLIKMAEKLSELRDIPLEEIQKITFDNGNRLYRIA